MPSKKKVVSNEDEQSEVKMIPPAMAARMANTCLAIVNFEQGAIPNTVRKNVPELEALMVGLAEGRFVIVQRPEDTMNGST